MAVINEPKYDEDVVNLGYLKRILGLKDTDTLTIVVTKNYGTAPNPPYNLNDTYMYEGKVYICIKARSVGEFNPNDWVLMADDSNLGDYATNDTLNKVEGELYKKIDETANGINIEVNKKFNTSDFTQANIVLAINQGTSNALINADKISLKGAVIDLTADDVIIKSNNFNVNKNGNVVITDTGNPNDHAFLTIVSPYGEHQLFSNGHQINETSYRGSLFGSSFECYDKNSDMHYIKGELENFGTPMYGRETQFEVRNGPGQILCTVYNETKEPVLFVSDANNVSSITPTSVNSGAFNNNSLATKKKDFKLLKSGLDIIEATDIYKYHWKNEKRNAKKHIGFVIGDDFNYSKEITNSDNDGADIYSMCAVAFKGIQELHEIINLQQEEIKKLKEKLK